MTDSHPTPAGLTLAQITVDCQDPTRQSAFWSALLDRPILPGANEYVAKLPAAEDGSLPALLFLAVPEPPTAKNRWHLDLSSADRERAVARALALGAEHRGDFDQWGVQWTTLADPEGNLFDVN